MRMLPALLFWSGLATLVYTFIGYPLLMCILAKIARHPQRDETAPASPPVTVVLTAFNEAPRIRSRIENVLASDYPKDRLQLVVVSDGSTDTTVNEIRSIRDERVQWIAEPVRTGKAHCLNTAIAAARGTVIVFCDARQRFEPDALRRLMEPFGDSRVGAVSGELEIEEAATAVGGGVTAYWRLEKLLRHAESQWDSCVGCTGAIYAIRRDLFHPLPSDTLLDDVVIPMRIAAQGFRVAFAPRARAHDPQPLEPGPESVRKRRTLAGNYQMLCRYPGWLLPWRHRLWWQLLSHKYLRLAAPWLLLSVFAANAMLAAHPVYRWLFAGQCALYALAAIGLALPARPLFLLSVPAGFVFLNWMAMNGLWHYLRRPSRAGWDSAPPDRTPAVRPPYV